MRAILINGFDQKIENIDLPTAVAAFQQEVRRLLRTEDWRIVDRKEWLTVIYDERMLSKETLCYFVDTISEYPFFGNLICIGRNPVTQVIEDLDEVLSHHHIFVSWMDKNSTEFYKIKYQEMVAKANRQ
jgi:hypothetical protein